MRMPENTNQDNSEYGHFMQWRVWFLFNKSIKDQDEKNIARGIVYGRQTRTQIVLIYMISCWKGKQFD